MCRPVASVGISRSHQRQASVPTHYSRANTTRTGRWSLRRGMLYGSVGARRQPAPVLVQLRPTSQGLCYSPDHTLDLLNGHPPAWRTSLPFDHIPQPSGLLLDHLRSRTSSTHRHAGHPHVLEIRPSGGAGGLLQRISLGFYSSGVDSWPRTRSQNRVRDSRDGLPAMVGWVDFGTALGQVGRAKQLPLLGEKTCRVGWESTARARCLHTHKPRYSVRPR